MKTQLLSFFLLFAGLAAIAQPTISGDTLLCPNGTGTAQVSGNTVYDSYQWYVRAAFTSDPFTAIAGATSATFSYDAYNYSLTEIKVLATLGTSGTFSNTLLIDSLVFLPIYTISDYGDNVTIGNDGTLLLCEGTTFTLSVGQPYTSNIQWYLNGVLIAGANSETLTVDAAGDYTVYAAPGECPDSGQTSLPTTVAINTECNLSTPSQQTTAFSIVPNPVKNRFDFISNASISTISIVDVSGKIVFETAPARLSGSVDLSALSSGIYILKAQSETGTTNLRLIKE